MKKALYLLALLLFGISSTAYSLPRELPVPGGVVQLDIGPLAPDYTRPEVFYNGHVAFVSAVNGQWTAFIGIPLNASPGEHTATLNLQGKTHKLKFSVLDKQYSEQRIKLKNKGQVDLSKKNLKRVNQEKNTIDDFKSYWRETADTDLEFHVPVDGRVSGSFGRKRFYNNKPRSPHSGIDFAVPKGTAIRAPARGTVIGTFNFFFTGNTVFVDHGNGLISLYAHLSKINVSPGHELEPGNKLGEVGSTGRATGPHLHWSVYLNGTAVDPELFLTRAEGSKKVFLY